MAANETNEQVFQQLNSGRIWTGTYGTDTLTNVERLKLSDFSITLDISGHAGSTARILGAVFGSAAVAKREYAGIGLQLLDAGMSYPDLIQLALNAKLGADNATVVNLLYNHVVGSPAPAGELAFNQGPLDSGVTPRPAWVCWLQTLTSTTPT